MKPEPMTDSQLLNLNLAIQQIIGNASVAKQEVLAWTLTYLQRDGDRVTMKTVWIPEQEKK